MDKLLNELVTRLREAYGDDLVSVVLYGSAASGDYQVKFSDLNILCILRVVGVPELQRGGRVIEWWRKQKQPPPLLLSVEETRNAHDAFPIEFLDIRQSHRVLYGEDLASQIQVNAAHHRRQVEHELRSGLLRLRARYLVMQRDGKGVIQLMAKSLPTFATLARHALLLAESGAPIRKREAFEAASQRFGLHPLPFETLLRIREGTQKVTGEQVHALFASYLEQITRLVQAVDNL
ncbi:MAG: nucleotidyltransferase domain-containing protein [Acidobacteria bacterium]|nr:nucleotidyltransferase domain-containing protein [Acidobacteriota bacterium]